MNTNGYTLTRPAARWEEGMLCGNGTVGAIVMGDAERERMIFAHESLFVPFNAKEEPIDMAAHLAAIRGMIAERKEEEACQAIVDVYRQENDGEGKLVWTAPFLPAAELIINSNLPNGYTNYSRSLDFATGEASIRFDTDGSACCRRVFVSRTAGACVIQLDAGDGSSDGFCYELTLDEPPFSEEDAKFYMSNFGTQPVFVEHRRDTKEAAVFIREFEGTNAGYAIAAVVAASDGDVNYDGGSISIRSATTVTVLVSINVIPDMGAYSIEDEMRRLSALPSSYEQLLREHSAVHTERYARLSMHLRDQAGPSDSDDETLWTSAREKEAVPPAFLEKIFNAGRYEILSSCGEKPPNLQGVWAGSYRVPWSSDYTQNGNVQTAISGLLPSGDFESLLSYFDYHEANLEHYRENSRRLYGCRGIHIPSRTSSMGYDIHFSASYPMLFWTAGAAWAARFYYDYWLYTGNHDFFVSRALPFMKEAALFYEDFLTEDEEGRWLFSPSYSPENTPLGKKSPATINATMDIAVAKELFANLIACCKTLGLLDEPIEAWERMLAKMPKYAINEDGALKEWAAPQYEDNYDHRHASQLYMLYYDIPEEIRNNRVLYQACETAYRLKRERKKNEQGTMAFGLVQMGMAAAHLQDSEMVEIMLRSMAQNNYYTTYASSHDYGPSLFNADISGGVPALMLESIVQCSPVTNADGTIARFEIVLLPALPSSMATGEVKGVRLRGGFVLDMTWRDGHVSHYTIHNPQGREYSLERISRQPELS